MVKTGPQKYPGASTAYWYQSKFGGSAMESNVGVLHTTEGRTVPSYGGGASAPNFTALPDIKNRRLRWYQHFDFDTSSRALVNLRGGVETNSLNAVQVELVGTCDERNASTWSGARAGVDYLFWPDAPDWALAELAKFVRWAHDQHGLKMQSTVTWKAYKRGQVGGSYGANGVRLSGAQWSAYYGWLGHQHVPENLHGDPGDLNFARVLEHAKGTANGPQKESQEDDMPSPEEIYNAVWRRDIVPVPGDYAKKAENPTWWAETMLRDTNAKVRALTGAVTELAAQGAARDAVLARLAEGGGLDAAEMQRAAQAGATAALDRLAIALAAHEED